jgi:hypothetical protein
MQLKAIEFVVEFSPAKRVHDFNDGENSQDSRRDILLALCTLSSFCAVKGCSLILRADFPQLLRL